MNSIVNWHLFLSLTFCTSNRLEEVIIVGLIGTKIHITYKTIAPTFAPNQVHNINSDR